MKREEPSKLDKEINDRKNEGKDKCPSIMGLEGILHGLQIHLINDSQQGCVPVIEIKFSELQFDVNRSDKKTNLSMTFLLNSNYYNLRASKWEPIIEKCGMDVDLNLNELSHPKKTVIISMNPEYPILNVNVSSSLFTVLKYAMNTWQQYKQSEDRKK